MSELNTDSDFNEAVLANELTRLRRYGVRNRSEKVALPTLEAIARLLGGDSQAINDQIKAVINAGAQPMAELRREAIVEVLDAGARHRQYLYLRRDYAASRLKVSRKHLEEYIEDDLIADLARHLVRLAREQQAKSNAPPSPAPVLAPSPRHPRTPAKTHSRDRANGALASEVRALLITSVKDTIEDDKVPLLAKTADAAYGTHGSIRDRVEALLTWAIAFLAVTDSWDIHALLALAGLGTKYQPDRATRERRAYELQFPERAYDPLDKADTLSIERFAFNLSEPLWVLASELDISCGPCLREMKTQRTFVEAPDPEINSMFGLILGATVGGSLTHVTYAEWSENTDTLTRQA